ncbi:ATP-dependent DNA helicase [Corynebacterium sp. 335C]
MGSGGSRDDARRAAGSTGAAAGDPGGGAGDEGDGGVAGLLGHAVAALGGARRDGQVRMAEAVDAAFSSGRHLAVQAGTGTGKSLAYLVPAVRHAVEGDATVVVSTATIALQAQLVDRDLPRLAKAVAPHLDRTPTFAILKGRGNYVCRKKLYDTAGAPEEDDQEGLIDEAELSRTARQVLKLREWAEETDTGDRDSLPFPVSGLAWRQVSVTSRECVGAASCPFGAECFAEEARAAAADVDVVVTNHSLLAIDALSDAAILPEHDLVVVDEAHELDSRITSVATDELLPVAMRLAATRAGKAGAPEEADDLDAAADMLTERLRDLGDDAVGRWTTLPEGIGDAIMALRAALWATMSKLAPDSAGMGGGAGAGVGGSGDGDRAERQIVRATCENLHDTCVRILQQIGSGDEAKGAAGPDVVWMTGDRHLAVAPLSVAGLLHDRLFGESTVVLTSATLVLGGRFDVMAARWGLPKGTWDGLDVGTPFDPARSGILYVASRLPRPGRGDTAPEALDQLEQLIMAAGGRTLALFSSRRRAEQAAEEMRARIPFDVLCQGEDSIGSLVSAFAAQENACLFGTLSLWQGVDVPGPSLSLVVIDRIPFPRPDDPLSSARSEAADREGRNGFREVSLAHAGLLMAQGAGRLLRSVGDRGVVAVLDPRLRTAGYGKFLISSMPPFWSTDRLDVACGALERLVAARHGR